MTWADDQSGEIKRAVLKDNVLSHLDNVAYKVKFFMIHPDHPIEGSELDEAYLKAANSVIIAETGVTTGFYIKDLGFNNYVSYKLQMRPLGITGQINIIEPFGMSLYEKLVIASHKLDIKNHLAAKYIIQITFNAHESTGEQVVVPFKWLVPILIEKMTSTVTEQGSDYTIAFYGLNYKASANIASTLKEPMTIEAKTFGEFLDGYTIALNNNQKDLKKMGAQSFPDRYEFIFDTGTPPIHIPWTNPTETDCRGFLLGANDSDNQDKSRKRDNWESRELRTGVSAFGERGRGRLSGVVKISASLGTDTKSFVEGVFMQTVEMKHRTVSGREATKTRSRKEFREMAKKETTRKDQLKEVGVGVKDDQAGGIDYYMGEGWENFTNKWYLFITATIKNGEWDSRRNTYSRTITYVLHQYRVLHAIQDGDEYKLKMDPTNIKQMTIDKMNALTQYGLLRKAYKWIYTGENSEVLGFNFSFNNLYYVATTTYPDTSLGERTPAAGTGHHMKQGDQESTIEHVNRSSVSAEHYDAAIDYYDPHHKKNRIFGLDETYLEDLSFDRTATDSIGDAPFSNPPYLPDIAPGDLIRGVGAGGLTTVNDPNRLIYNINSGDMMELQMQIRGDPFWLGHSIKQSIVNTPPEDHAPYSAGANYLYIEFRVPQGVDSESGQMEMGLANNISGIYFITNVQSNFSDGQFVQSLTGYLDMTFGLSVVRNYIANDTGGETGRNGGHFLNPTGGIQ